MVAVSSWEWGCVLLGDSGMVCTAHSTFWPGCGTIGEDTRNSVTSLGWLAGLAEDLRRGYNAWHRWFKENVMDFHRAVKFFRAGGLFVALLSACVLLASGAAFSMISINSA